MQGNFFSCACTHALQVSFNISWYVVQMHRLLCAGKIYVNINTVVDTISKSTCKVSSCTVGTWEPVVIRHVFSILYHLIFIFGFGFQVPKSYANISYFSWWYGTVKYSKYSLLAGQKYHTNTNHQNFLLLLLLLLKHAQPQCSTTLCSWSPPRC